MKQRKVFTSNHKKDAITYIPRAESRARDATTREGARNPQESWQPIRRDKTHHVSLRAPGRIPPISFAGTCAVANDIERRVNRGHRAAESNGDVELRDRVRAAKRRILW